MASLRPQYEIQSVRNFLQGQLDGRVENLRAAKGGEASQVFMYRHEGSERVLRIGRNRLSYEKDEYAYRHFASEALPVPRVFQIGAFDSECFFDLSERMPGVPSDSLPASDCKGRISALADVLAEIHRFDTANVETFGVFDKNGIGPKSTWRDVLLTMLEDEWLDYN